MIAPQIWGLVLLIIGASLLGLTMYLDEVKGRREGGMGAMAFFLLIVGSTLLIACI